MRKLILVLLILLPLGACKASAPQALDLDLYSDRGFAVKLEEIFADAAPYEGAAVRMTGQYHASGGYAYVLRTAPDGTQVGFELVWDGQAPDLGQWILVVGRLESYIEDDESYLQIAAEQIYRTGRRDASVAISEGAFLADLAQLYETADEHLGARVTLTGLCGADYVYRTAEYRDGRTGTVGLEFLSLSAPPEEGAWITVTGTLCAYDRDGEEVLILADAVITPAEPAQNPIKEAP